MMTERTITCVVACENHRRDLEAILSGEDFEGVVCRFFPADCLPGLERNATRAAMLQRCCDDFAAVDVLGGPCLAQCAARGDGTEECRFHHLEPACVPTVDERMAAELVTAGSYLLTSGWLERWREQMAAMGLDRDTARELFGETCEVLTLFDTGLWPEAAIEFAALGEWLDLPTRRIAVGLERFRLRVSRIVMQRRIERLEGDRDAARADTERRTAEYETVLDLLSQLTKVVRKEDVIVTLFDLFAQVLGASRCTLATVSDGALQVVAARPPGGQLDPLAAAAVLESQHGYLLNDAGDGFLLSMKEFGEARAVVEVAGLALPAYRERYLDLAIPAARVFGLAYARARAIEEIERLQDSVAHDHRLKATGTLASGVAHEINNPLAVILNFAELLSDEVALEGEAAEYLEEIVSHAQRISAIVTRLADFAGQGKVTAAAITPRALLESALGLMGSRFDADGIEVVVDIPDDLPSVPCDIRGLQQVLVTLLTNALEALNERYPATHEDKVLRLHAMVAPGGDASMVRLTVENHGADLSDEARAHLFEPFFTARSRSRHAGLGLFVGHGIVARHGGRLRLEFEPGRFTRFHVDLPTAPGT
jgi:signal transduction histidine kinase